ncbi:glycoside hydrolase family 3 protein [Haloactinomyces albus]|uniref:beta-glucosidase n=1 Tax=Haloactinomyces albus TaxID=1352928 RepID=A0AAE3ZG79_9ACTN|nr:glycoside hydrolase family 3 N-terminal domain-containing protein [Haloactinomyces albus]MDR7304338.1 beta-glucosidase [Haloactinomyces albus]
MKDIIEVEGKRFRDLNGNGRLDPYENWHLPAKVRAADLVRRMTLEEKAGLMQISSERSRGQSSSPSPTGEAVASIERRHLRYLIIRDDPTAEVLATRANEYQEIAEGTRLGIPVVFTSNPRNHINGEGTFGVSEAGGEFSTWPGELGLAATRDPALVKEFAQVAAAEWRASGIHKMYGYMADTATDPRWTRVSGTFGEHPGLAADMTTAIVEGFQGEELGKGSVSLTIKHFPGGGARSGGRDPHFAWGQNQLWPTEGSLSKYHLPPFQAAIEAGTTSIMPYYSKPVNEGSAQQLPKHLWYSEDQQFEEVAFAYNKSLLQGLLRDEMGFSGYVNSDSGVIDGKPWGVENLTEPERYAKAVKAGTNLFSDTNEPAPLIEAVNTGLLSESDLDPSVTFLLTEMFELGLFEDPYVDPQRAQRIADDPESQAKADKAHRKSVVLLRNDQDLLPITDKDVTDVKLYVEAFTEEGAAKASTALAERIAEYDPSITIVDTPEEATHALLSVRPSLSVFEDDTRGDPPSVELGKDSDTGIDVERIRALQSRVENTILQINMGNPWLINEIEPGADAVLATFSVKPEAIVDVLRGEYAPTGKLPLTVPAGKEAVESNASDVPGYAERPGYAYVDSAGNTYEYGFGLSYGR